MPAQMPPPNALSRRALFRQAASGAIIAAVFACCQGDRVQPDRTLISSAERLLVCDLSEKDLEVLLAHTYRTVGRDHWGMVELSNGSTLHYRYESLSGRLWGYTEIHFGKIKWVDCPQPNDCTIGTGDTFAEHFFAAAPK